jgi:hypothetical protein
MDMNRLQRYGMKRQLRLIVLHLCMAGACSITATAATISSVTDPTTNWTSVPVVGLDPSVDQQTGQVDADLVGIVADPAFYTAFDGTNIYFRARLGAVTNGGNFKGLLWVGIDANQDGALDLFIGVNNQGSTTQLGFFAAGAGLNNSPSTTSIANGLAPYQIAETPTNFNYQAVNSTLDPTITTTDINNDGIDAFISFRVPFLGVSGSASLQGALAGLDSISVTKDSRFSYVIATSTQSNSLNQDIGGVNNKTFNPALTYTQLGAISPQITGTGVVAPEPGTLGYFSISLAVLAALRIARMRNSRRCEN